MIRRIFIAIVACLMFLLFAVGAQALEWGEYEFTVDDSGNATITGYTGAGGDLVIPAVLGDAGQYPVTAIGEFTFFFNDALTGVTLPDGLTSIGADAFGLCESLKSVTLPESLTEIGETAFEGCSVLPGIRIPDSVKSIGWGAFSYCCELSSINIPASLETLGSAPFANCAKLQAITVAPDHPCFELAGPALVDKVNHRLVVYPAASREMRAFEIPDTVTVIGESAFDSCVNLIKIIIPDSVTEIKDYAFYTCVNLSGITIPGSVTSFGESVFTGCYQLKKFTVSPDCPVLSTVDGVLFSKDGTTLLCYPGARQGNEYSIPEGTVTIGDGAFLAASALERVVCPEGLKNIGNNAFFDNSRLTSVYVPASVTHLESSAFEACPNLTVFAPEGSEALRICMLNDIPCKASN